MVLGDRTLQDVVCAFFENKKCGNINPHVYTFIQLESTIYATNTHIEMIKQELNEEGLQNAVF